MFNPTSIALVAIAIWTASVSAVPVVSSSDLSFEARAIDTSAYDLVGREFDDFDLESREFEDFDLDLRDIDESDIFMREMTKRKVPAKPAGKPGQAGGEYKPLERLPFGGGHGPEVMTKPGYNLLSKPPHGGSSGKPKPHRPQYGGPGAKPPKNGGGKTPNHKKPTAGGMGGGLSGLQGGQMTGPGEFIDSGNGLSIESNIGAGGNAKITTNFL